MVILFSEGDKLDLHGKTLQTRRMRGRERRREKKERERK